MVLKSKTFYITQNNTLSNISNYLNTVIGKDAYLVKKIQASLLSPNNVSINILYEDTPDNLISCISPSIGSILGTGLRSANFCASFLFNKPIDQISLSNGSIEIDCNILYSGDALVNNLYQLQIRLSGNNYQQSGIHNYYFKTGFRFL